jgi:hypothetical protein
MTQIVLFTRKNVWGNEMFYPANTQGALLLSLTGRKTFTKNDFDLFRKLGYDVKEAYGTADPVSKPDIAINEYIY